MRAIATVIAALILLGACAQGTVPVINKMPSRKIPEAYVVNTGDSIYEIAWAFGLDYADIAEWNKLSPPYKLSAKQVIRLREPGTSVTALDSSDTQSEGPIVAQSLPEKPKSASPASQPANTKVVTFSNSPGQWNWPAEGNLVGRFSPDKGSNGIQIAGEPGSPVRATASGQVVYVGQGLRGYGKLIILKHSETFLSAYAHNRDILVREGQVIQSREKIGTMGQSGAQDTMLHFEIRRDGKPVDPLTYLN